MSRLFEALSDVQVYHSPPTTVLRAEPSHDVIHLSVRGVDVIPPLSAEEAETEQLSPEAAPVDVTVSEDESASDVTAPLSAEEAETGQQSSEGVPVRVSVSYVAPLLSAEEAGTEQSPKAAPVDVSPFEEESDVTSPVSAEGVEAEQNPAESVPVRVCVSDVTPPLFAGNAETEQLSPEALPVHMSPSEEESASDVAPPLSAEDAETEQHSAEGVSVSVSVSDVTPPLSTQEAETEQLSPEAAPVDVAASEEQSASAVASPLSVEQAETEQLLPDAAPVDVSPSDVAQPFSAQEAAVATDSRPKSVESAPARPVAIKVPPESRLVALTDPNSLGAEKFRALVTRLEHLRKERELKCFQVTSSVIHEGKTVVSGNVAVTLAKYSGSKTLLIEGDLHRPTLATMFGLNNIRGLSHWWYRQGQDLAQFVYRLGDLPLWFLPAGNPYDRPSDILRSARFVNAFAQLASRFEWVVVDSTPMLPIVDVNLWSRLVDGTLLVVREGVTPVKALKQGLLALDHPKLIGVVLNDATATTEAKYDGQYYGSTKRQPPKRVRA